MANATHRTTQCLESQTEDNCDDFQLTPAPRKQGGGPTAFSGGALEHSMEFQGSGARGQGEPQLLNDVQEVRVGCECCGALLSVSRRSSCSTQAGSSI